MKPWVTHGVELRLGREPYDDDPSLQAWNAADELLARCLVESDPDGLRPVVVFNDAFGVLSCFGARLGRLLTQVSDSFLSQQCTRLNLAANGLESADVVLQDSLTPLDGLAKRTGGGGLLPLVILRLPKGLALLEFQLHQIRRWLPAGGSLVAAAMTKDVHTSSLALFQNIIGPTTTSLAHKKARLIQATVADQVIPSNPWPQKWLVPSVDSGVTDLTVLNHAGVFSRQGLDGGTRLLLKHFPSVAAGELAVIDLGCGNGILGLVAAGRYPEATIIAIDESYMAVQSAKASFQLNHLAGRSHCVVGDGLTAMATASADLILCNPPFHYQNAQTLAIALAMFDQAKRVLKPGGELRVVANAHLGYQSALVARFGEVTLIAGDRRFVVLSVRVTR